MSTTLISSLKFATLLPSSIIPETFTTSINLTVSFPTISPSDGALVRVSQVAQQPTISISSTTPSPSAQFFTLLLIDPDAPTPDDPKFAYWRHWVVTNISTSSPSFDASDVVKSGTTVTPYLAPGPKDESGPHRYLFLLFREPEGFEVGKEDFGGEEFVDRRSFGAREWVEKWGLELVGVQWMRGVGDGWVDGEAGVEEKREL